MVTNAASIPEQSIPFWLRGISGEQFKYVWLTVGFVTALLAVGGRWDVPIAAWIAPVFLLRFARLSRPASGLLLVWAISVASAVFWGFQLGVPLQPSTLAGHLAFGTVYTLPFILDRALARRLGIVGQLLLFPAAIVASEYLMATFSPLGTAYGMKAITQSSNLSLLQIISITGPYAIGFLIGLIATAANRMWERPHEHGSQTALALSGGLVLLVIILGSVRLAFFPSATDYVQMAGITPSGEVLRRAEAASGGTFPQGPEAFAAADRQKVRAGFDLVTDELIDSTRQAAAAGAKIVVWSETAARTLSDDKPALLARVANVASEEGIYINVALGIPFTANETHLIDPSGKLLWSYQKTYPVPGMEPVPPGNTPVPIVQSPFGRLTNVICFDADFPALARVDADIMIVPGYDWPEIGRVHTLKMASLRAIENGYSLIRQDFFGQSAAFDPLGNLLATQDTTSRARHLMMVDVPVRGSRTIYNVIGDLFAWLCAAAIFVLVVTALRRREPTAG